MIETDAPAGTSNAVAVPASDAATIWNWPSADATPIVPGTFNTQSPPVLRMGWVT